MKHPAIVLSSLAALAAVATALAQGTVNFRTYGIAGINAPVFGSDFRTRLGSSYYGQLHAGPSPDSLAPVGEPVPFLDWNGQPTGYINGGHVEIPTVPEGGLAYVQLRAWPAAAGPSFAAARAAGGEWGTSLILITQTGGEHLDPPYVSIPLVGLVSFALVPEPAPSWLTLAGLGVLLASRLNTIRLGSSPDTKNAHD